jgi:hypothetical protein
VRFRKNAWMVATRDVIVQSERFDDAIAVYCDVFGFELTVATDKLAGFETAVDLEFRDHAADRRKHLDTIDAARRTHEPVPLRRSSRDHPREIIVGRGDDARPLRGYDSTSDSMRATILPIRRSASSFELPSA